jgi:hypothetical protein
VPAATANHKSQEEIVNKHHRMILIAMVLGTSIGSGLVARSLAQAQKEAAGATLAFNTLKSIAGRWEADTDKGKVSTTYEATLIFPDERRISAGRS